MERTLATAFKRSGAAAIVGGVVFGGVLACLTIQENLGYNFYDPDGGIYFDGIALVTVLSILMGVTICGLTWFSAEVLFGGAACLFSQLRRWRRP